MCNTVTATLNINEVIVMLNIKVFVFGQCETNCICIAFNLSSFLVYFFTFFRFSGVPPSNLGSNTKLVDWMPQNDLLGEHIKEATT